MTKKKENERTKEKSAHRGKYNAENEKDRKREASDGGG